MTHTSAPHPFLPGVSVLSLDRKSQRWVKDRVAKLHKTGRFTLENQGINQFKAYQKRESGKFSHWECRAIRDGEYSSYVSLLWSPELEAKLRAESLVEATA